MTMHNGLVFQNEKFNKIIASKDTSDYKVVFRNQLVISFPIDEGVLAAQRITDAGIVSPAYGIWDIDHSRVLPEYLEFALRCNRALQYYKANLRGSTARRRSLPTPTLLAFKVPLPSIQEQEKILADIHLVKSALDNRKAQIKKLSELTKARFVEMFGDPVKNDKGFDSKLGSEVFKLSNGKFVPEDKRFDSGIPVYGGNGISWFTDELLFEKDTIVVGRVGFQSGNVHLVGGPLWVSDNAMYISNFYDDGYDLQFLFAVMEHIDFTRFQDAGDLKKITQKPFMQMLYIKPPIEMQQEYNAFVAQVDKSKYQAEPNSRKYYIHRLRKQYQELTDSLFLYFTKLFEVIIFQKGIC